MVLFNEAYSEREIRMKVACSKTAVHIAIMNFQNLGTFSDEGSNEHPCKTRTRNNHLIIPT